MAPVNPSDHAEIREALRREERHAPAAADVLAELSRRTDSRRRLASRRRNGILAVAAAVAVIVSATTVATISRSHRQPGPADPPVASPTLLTSSTQSSLANGQTTVSATTGKSGSGESTGTAADVTAAQFAAGHWTNLPAAPIKGRSAAAYSWTGSQLIVWGGSVSSADTYFSDGAAYDPVTRSWQTLPASPLSARADPQFAWTGRALFIWGGNNGGTSGLTDGAFYTPATRSWTTMPAAPLTGYSRAVLEWNGSSLVLISIAASKAASIQAASFDPATGRWARLPDLTLPEKHPSEELFAAAAGGSIYLWSQWAQSSLGPVPGSAMVSAGTDSYLLDSSLRWSPVHWTLPGTTGLGDILWTGRDLIVGPAQRWCGYCPGPMQMNQTAFLLDPANGVARALPHGPVDDLRARYLWTGNTLLAFDSSVLTTGGAHSDHPGEAAAWDRKTNSWTRLPDAPLAGDGSVPAVWTGTSLLLWGELFSGKQTGSDSTKYQEAGLEFVPAR